MKLLQSICLPLVILSGTTAGCAKPLHDDSCISLIVTSAPAVGNEAVCLLIPGLTPAELVAESVFGAVGPTSLRGRISSLDVPISYRIDSDGQRWAVFQVGARTTEAACVTATSVAEKNACFWHLRSRVELGDILDERLKSIVESVTSVRGEAILSVVGPARSDASAESIAVTIRDRKPILIDWFDPTGTRGLSPPWYSQP